MVDFFGKCFCRDLMNTEIYIHLGDEIVKEMSENMVEVLESLNS